MAKYWRNNFPIWSHWLPARPVKRGFKLEFVDRNSTGRAINGANYRWQSNWRRRNIFAAIATSHQTKRRRRRRVVFSTSIGQASLPLRPLLPRPPLTGDPCRAFLSGKQHYSNQTNHHLRLIGQYTNYHTVLFLALSLFTFLLLTHSLSLSRLFISVMVSLSIIHTSIVYCWCTSLSPCFAHKQANKPPIIPSSLSHLSTQT